MAQRRMFSPKVTSTDVFLDMPVSARELYFQLGMNADDDGFVTPRKIMRMIGASDDDLRVLTAKNFVIPFQSGVIVISGWRVNNLIRKDWYQETIYKEEKAQLCVKDNGEYQLVNEMLPNSLPNCSHRLGKVSLIKNISAADAAGASKKVNPKTDPTPMSLKEFGEWCKKSSSRHVRLIADYADEKKVDFTTKGQWNGFIARNTRAASLLAAFSDDQLAEAMSRLKKAESGYLGRWTLETLLRYTEPDH